VFSNSLEEHVEHVRKVLARLNDFNLRVNFEKLEFARREIVILGYFISERGVEVCKEKVLAINNWKSPKTGNQLEKHLGFFNYF
jgi:isocitrate/isopropylmalate dehydrogenase